MQIKPPLTLQALLGDIIDFLHELVILYHESCDSLATQHPKLQKVDMFPGPERGGEIS